MSSVIRPSSVTPKKSRYFNPTTPLSTAQNHGRIEIRNIWVTSAFNDYLDFPPIGQVFKVERVIHHKKSKKQTQEIIYGITSKSPGLARAAQVLQDNRGHGCIENSCHYIIDWNYGEDRRRIEKEFGPENMTRLRRFAVSLLKARMSAVLLRKCGN